MSVVKNNDFRQGQGPGLVLLQARQALSITQAETADVLNLSVRVIIALESNDDSALPERVYVNGYIRSYAKLLGLAAEPLIKAWGAQFPDEMQSQRADLDEEQARNWSVASTNPRESTGLVRWILVAFLLSGVFIYFVSSQEPSEAPSEVALVDDQAIESEELADLQEPLAEQALVEEIAVEEVVVEEVLVDLANGTGEEASGLAISADNAAVVEAITPAIVIRPEPEPEPEPEPLVEMPLQTSVVSDASVSSASVALAGLLEEPSGESNTLEATTLVADDAKTEAAVDRAGLTDALDSSTQPVLSESDTALAAPEFQLPRLTLGGDDRIVLSFAADCWFEIRNLEGEMLHADLGRPEQIREYFGQGPFSIKLGFAQGAAVEFNGSSVALAPHTRNNVAKLILGQ